MAFEQYEVNFEIDKFLSHNGQTADPLNKFSKALKIISGKRGKTDEDYAAMARIEKEASLYLTSNGEITIDSRLIEAAILEGARKTKEGKLSLGCVWVDSVSPIYFDGSTPKKPLTFEAYMEAEGKYTLCVSVRVNKAKVMRTRALFENVKGSFIVSLDNTVADADQLEKWIHAAFNQVGLGDWRPRYGRGRVVSMKKVK